MKHKQAWTVVALLFLTFLGSIFLGGWQINNGGSGGSGTVTNTGGALTANAVVLGAGGADTKVSTGITSNGASELDLGLNGTAAGVMGLNGSTSGKATYTAPAVAGTVTNPVAMTNFLAGPTSATGPVYGFSGTTVGLGVDPTVWGNVPTLWSAGVRQAVWTSGGQLILPTSWGMTYSPNINSSTAGQQPLNYGPANPPTIAAAGCGGSGASIPNNNGTAAFTVNVGSAPTSAGCTLTMTAAAHDWVCSCSDLTTTSTSVFLCKQTGAASTTSVTLQNFSDVAAATAFTASDVLRVSCFGY